MSFDEGVVRNRFVVKTWAFPQRLKADRHLDFPGNAMEHHLSLYKLTSLRLWVEYMIAEIVRLKRQNSTLVDTDPPVDEWFSKVSVATL